MNETLRKRLLDMIEEDKRVGATLAAEGVLHDGYHPRMEAVHNKNAEALEKIILKRGWLTETEVSRDGLQAAWMIVQHAIGKPAFIRKCLPLIKQAIEANRENPKHAAYLEDRIRYLEGKPQKYGTQFDWDKNGKLHPWTIEDPAKVEKLRESVGLPALAKAMEAMLEGIKKSGEKPPADWEKRNEEQIAWAKKVGWRS